MFPKVGAILSLEKNDAYCGFGRLHCHRDFRGEELEQTWRHFSCDYQEKRRVQQVDRLLDNPTLVLHDHEIAFGVQVHLLVPGESLSQRWNVQLDIALHPSLELLYHRDKLLPLRRLYLGKPG